MNHYTMKIYKIAKKCKDFKVKRTKKRPKSHTGKMEGAFNPPNWSGKLDTRLTPVHRYVLETNFPVIEKKSGE